MFEVRVLDTKIADRIVSCDENKAMPHVTMTLVRDNNWLRKKGIEGLQTVDDDSNDEIENHKDHDENIDVVPKVGTDSVVKPNLM